MEDFAKKNGEIYVPNIVLDTPADYIFILRSRPFPA